MFHDVRIRGRLRSLATACYPPMVLDLRIEEQGRIRGPGHVGVALVDVAVVLALAPLPVRSQEVESVDSGHRPLGSLLVPARGVGALGLDVTGLDPRIDTGHTVTACGVTGGGLLTAPGRAISVCVSLPAGEIGVTTSGRTLSRIARVTARGHAGDYLALLEETGRLARRETQEGVGAVALQPPLVSEAAAAVPPVAGGAVLTALPSALQDLARYFLSLSGSSSLWQLEALRE